MKISALKKSAPTIAIIAGLAFISAVAHAARVESQQATKVRPMQTACPKPSTTPPTE